MKRTIATKMIVMSNELRTRGSIPGAIRSEIITRSSAWAVATRTTSWDGKDAAKIAVANCACLGNSRVLEETRQQRRSHRQRLDKDVLVRAVGAGAVRAQAVEHRDAE